jgi:hypothetical protein
LGRRPSAKEEINRAQFAHCCSASSEENDWDEELLLALVNKRLRRLFAGTEYPLVEGVANRKYKVEAVILESGML